VRLVTCSITCRLGSQWGHDGTALLACHSCAMERQCWHNFNCSTWDGAIECPAGAFRPAIYCRTIQTPTPPPHHIKQTGLFARVCQTTRRHILGDSNVHQNRCGNLKSRNLFAICCLSAFLPNNSCSSKRHIRYIFLSRTQILCSQVEP